MSGQINIFYQARRYWSLGLLFGGVALVLTASIVEDRIATRIPATAVANLYESIPIDSLSIEDIGRLTIDREGQPFSALNLNGKDNLVLMAPSFGSLPNAFSLCFWVAAKDTGRLQTIFHKGENCPRADLHDKGCSYQVAIAANGKLLMTIFSTNGVFVQFTASEPLVPDQWSFVVLSLTADRTFECFINTVAVATTASNEQPLSLDRICKTESVLKIGGDENFCGGFHYFDHLLEGLVDEITIFDRPLSVAEIVRLYEPGTKKYIKYRVILIAISGLFLAITISQYFRRRTAL